jgi:hypothetical protein
LPPCSKESFCVQYLCSRQRVRDSPGAVVSSSSLHAPAAPVPLDGLASLQSVAAATRTERWGVRRFLEKKMLSSPQTAGIILQRLPRCSYFKLKLHHRWRATKNRRSLFAWFHNFLLLGKDNRDRIGVAPTSVRRVGQSAKQEGRGRQEASTATIAVSRSSHLTLSVLTHPAIAPAASPGATADTPRNRDHDGCVVRDDQRPPLARPRRPPTPALWAIPYMTSTRAATTRSPTCRSINTQGY